MATWDLSNHRIIQGMDSWLTYLRFDYATSAHLLHFTSSKRLSIPFKIKKTFSTPYGKDFK